MSPTPGQRKCIETLDEPLVVAAGAGSGKTMTLTLRIVHALESGFVDDIDQVLAITFTRKAAGELKSRVKAALRADGRIDQALKVDDAWISTIHGMCSRILREHAIELGIDPGFALADGAALARLQAAAVDSVLADAQVARAAEGEGEGEDAGSASADAAVGVGAPSGDAPAAGASTAHGIAGVAPEDLRALFAEFPARSGASFSTSVEDMLLQLVEKASANPAGADAFTLPPDPVPPIRTLQRALTLYQGLRDSVPGGKPSAAQEAWEAQADDAIRVASVALDTGSVDAVRAIGYVGAFPLSKRFGGKPFKERVDEVQVEIDSCLLDLYAALTQGQLQTLLALAREVYARYVIAKQQRGILDTNDLLTRAADALESHPAIAAEYADKFKLIMIDEFQDTDQMQVDMIKRLAGPSMERLCTVGDAQQSIYRFRGADVQVYRRHLAEVDARNHDDVIYLPDNFRSHGDVLSFVDRVFERDDMFGGEFMSLSNSRDESWVKRPYRGSGARISVQLTSTSQRGGASGPEVTERVAERIAEKFTQLKREGHAASDMVVLLGRMTNAGVYAQQLRAHGLPCVIAGGTVFAKSSEVNVVRALLDWLANPHDTQALLTVATSPLFALSAGDLVDVGTTNAPDGLPRRRRLDRGVAELGRLVDLAAGVYGSPDQLTVEERSAVKALSPELACAVRVLARLRYGVGREPLAALLERAVVDAGWIARLEGHGGEGQAVAANVYKAIRIVGDLEGDRKAPVGPATLARWFSDVLDGSKEGPGALSATGSDFVRIMTVHASKGLEFPIVAVADLPGKAKSLPKFLARPLDGRIYVALQPSGTLSRPSMPKGAKLSRARMEAAAQRLFGENLEEEDFLNKALTCDSAAERYLALALADASGDEEEAKRLLYVALTRAKEALVVSMQGRSNKSNPNAVPDNVLGAVVGALTGDDAGFPVGNSGYEFGGERPAEVAHERLGRGGVIESADGGADADAMADVAADAALADAVDPDAPTFALPAPDGTRRLLREEYAPARESVFSYSSIAPTSHGKGLLATLADAYAVGSDGAPDDDPVAFAAPADATSDLLVAFAPEDTGEHVRSQHARNVAASFEDDDLSSRLYFRDDAGDEDKATDLGTAFHRLAQLAVVTRAPGEPLRVPGASRLASVVRSAKLDADQRIRLKGALDRWFGSDVARTVVAFAEGEDANAQSAPARGAVPAGSLAAEVPFFLQLAGSGAPYLEGSIDLLATAPDGARALVVDYKTGGRRDERDADLRQKHVLQASCYALALLRQGYAQVDAVFVRVEQGRFDDNAQPQCVRYRFDAADEPTLTREVGRACALRR
ncbi:MAG: UvrD-helicase domain-containing protein [Eggerthellaceae bacterium]|jgi:ATP-dependent helicase/nuclease subunit A